MRTKSLSGWIRRTCYLAVLAALILQSGCIRRYQVTLNNGAIITTHSKPKLDKSTGVYRFRDAHGKPQLVPAFKVREIAPQ